jgi:caffeoyl-CoA O-methyltransferase
LAFIDADKPNYVHYWDELVPMLSPGGLIIVDNVLWGGSVLAPETDSDHAIVAFNEHANSDDRMEQVMLTVRDGITVARRRT